MTASWCSSHAGAPSLPSVTQANSSHSVDRSLACQSACTITLLFQPKELATQRRLLPLHTLIEGSCCQIQIGCHWCGCGDRQVRLAGEPAFCAQLPPSDVLRPAPAAPVQVSGARRAAPLSSAPARWGARECLRSGAPAYAAGPVNLLVRGLWRRAHPPLGILFRTTTPLGS